MKIPNKLREYRKQKGLRQRDVARELGFYSDERISKWEQGKAVPHLMNLFKLCVLYDAYPHQLYGEVLKKLWEERKSANEAFSEFI